MSDNVMILMMGRSLDDSSIMKSFTRICTNGSWCAMILKCIW
jgi:hypothetical protein